ncbi:MAG: YoaK family protein, partial [Maribacter arcticus]|uniref:YoaK family protein n=1 Tax=Maribacter arcticus TaxID=561365 RepID=UPI0030036695
SFLIETFRKNKKLNVFVLPTLIECFILASVGFLGSAAVIKYPDVIICLLLYAMGLHNSFVTKISNAVVRTTHLTGLFTDLGIELSQLLFHKSYLKTEKIKETIKLRIYIICFFFLGGIIGGLLYSRLNLKLNTLTIASLILLVSLFYDDFKYKIIKVKRRYNQRRH